jgi:DNA primase
MSDELENLLTEKGIRYTKKSNSLLIRCVNPEHQDNNPSMLVNPTTGHATCMSCGYKTNIFQHFGRYLRTFSKNIYDTLRAIDKAIIDIKGVEEISGQTPVNHDYRGLPAKFLNDFGFFRAYGNYGANPLENRLWLDLRDFNGVLRGYIGRDYTSNYSHKTKYLVIPSGSEKPWYNLDAQPTNNALIIVEGVFDVANLAYHNVTNVVAMLGAIPSKTSYGSYLKPLLAKGVNKVVVALDSDKAGQEGALKLKTFLNKNYPQVEVEVLEFDEGVDPGSLNKEQVNLYFKEWINEDNPNHE